MRIKAAFLAAAVLFGVATASSNAAKPSIATVFVPTAGKVSSVDNGVTAKSDLCNTLCWRPWHGCVDKCGGTQACKLECSCLLFSDPDLSCRTDDCVPAPEHCTKPEHHVTATSNAHEHSSQADVVVERKINTGDTAPQRPTTNEESANNLEVSMPPPLLPCLNCWDAIEWCKRDCGTPGCASKCLCFMANHNVNCEMCGVKCRDKGSNTTTSALQHADLDPRAPIPPPNINPCVYCHSAIYYCNKRCDSEACRTICACMQKEYNRNCKECKVNCKCGHYVNCSTSLRAAARDVDVLPPPPPNPCLNCQYAINACKKKCKTPGPSCDDACACREKGQNPNCRGCKIGQNCAASLEKSSIDTSIPPPPMNPCVLCQWSINNCKKRCKRSDRCEAACACIKKEFHPNCRQCNIKCECEGKKCASEMKLLRRSEGADEFKPPQNNVDFSKTSTPSLGDPGKSCFLCNWEASYCLTKKCPPQAPCRELCSCDVIRYFPFCEKRCSYKCGDSALAQLASTLKPNSDKLELGPSLPAANNSKATESNAPGRRDAKPVDETPATKTVEVDATIPPTIRPPNQCELCMQTFNSCRKNLCAVPGGCDEICECWVSHVEKCKKCPFKCSTLLTMG